MSYNVIMNFFLAFVIYYNPLNSIPCIIIRQCTENLYNNPTEQHYFNVHQSKLVNAFVINFSTLAIFVYARKSSAVVKLIIYE